MVQEGPLTPDRGSQRVESSSAKRSWTPDRESNSCLNCGSGFTLLGRRHHCRACGQLLCAKCTQWRSTKVPGYIGTSVRCCEKCIRAIQTQASSTQQRKQELKTKQTISAPDLSTLSTKELVLEVKGATEKAKLLDDTPIALGSGTGSGEDSTAAGNLLSALDALAWSEEDKVKGLEMCETNQDSKEESKEERKHSGKDEQTEQGDVRAAEAVSNQGRRPGQQAEKETLARKEQSSYSSFMRSPYIRFAVVMLAFWFARRTLFSRSKK